MSQGRSAVQHPSEASPLLGDNVTRSAQTNNTLTPDGPAAESITHGNGTFQAQGKPTSADAQQDVEQQPQTAVAAEEEEVSPTAFEGLPEVKKRMPIIFPALAIGVLLSSADQTIIVSSYGRIGSELNALNQTSWIATAYFLTLTAFQPLYGKLSDIFGRKPCLLFCYAVFGLGCLGCGLAQTMNQLIAARAVAGIGGGGMNVVVVVMMSDILPLRERGVWQGYFNMVFAAGSSAGAPLGGLFADSIGWRWAFLAQAPLCLVAILAVGATLQLPKRADEAEMGWTEKLRRVDLLGALTLLVAVGSLLLALDRGSNVSWTAPISYASLIVSVVLFAAFLVVEVRIAKEPFAPGHVIFNRTMIACYLCNFFSMASYFSAVFFAPLYFQAVHDLSAFDAGLHLIPAAVSAVVGSMSAGVYMKKTGRFYWLSIIAYGVFMLGMVAVGLSSGLVVHSVIGLTVGLSFGALGNGAGVTATLIGLLANVAREDQSTAVACSYLFRSLGSVSGISVSATLANQVLRGQLASQLPALGLSESKALEIAAKVRESLAYLRELEPDVRAVVTACYAQSTQAAFWMDAGLALCTIVTACFIFEKILTK